MSDLNMMIDMQRCYVRFQGKSDSIRAGQKAFSLSLYKGLNFLGKEKKKILRLFRIGSDLKEKTRRRRKKIVHVNTLRCLWRGEN